MVTALGVLIAALTATPPVVAGLWIAEWWRSGRRNRRGACGSCAETLSDELDDRFLVSGRLICSGCAGAMKRRMPWLLGTLLVLLTGSAIATAIMADGIEWVLSPLIMFGFGLGAIQLMKVANRRAQRRIATGGVPQIALGADDAPESDPAQLPPQHA